MDTKISDFQLLVVGRPIVSDQHHYYTNNEHCDFLNQFSENFSKTVYLSFSEKESAPEQREDISRLSSNITVIENDIFNNTNNPIEWIRSLQEDIRIVKSMPSKTISYVFYPGVYSFIMSHSVVSNSSFNISYFGNESEDAARSTSIKQPLGISKRVLYPWAQRYVLNNSDITFVRDPRMKEYNIEGEIVFSAPVTSFEPINTSNNTSELTSPIKLLTVAKARRSKGYKYLIKALSELKKSQFQFRGIFVGQGVNKYEDIAIKNEVDDIIDFVGHINSQEKLAKLYSNSDIFVLPSVSEGFPRVITEAMSMRLPVAATKVGGIPHVLSDNENVKLVKPKDPDSLAEGILSLINDKNARKEIIENGYNWGQKQIKTNSVKQQIRVIRNRLEDN